MKLLVHKSELSKITIHHYNAIREALPDLECIVFKEADEIPSLKDEEVFKIGNSMFLGSEIFDALKERLQECNRAVLITDDYTTPPPTQVRQGIAGKDNVMLTTCPNIYDHVNHKTVWSSWIRNVIYVNWNLATWHPQPLREPELIGKLFYYGAFREGRVPYFEKYLNNPYTVISTTPKGEDKLEEYCYDSVFTQRIQTTDLWKASMTVYMEDIGSHKIYSSPANRFWECLSNGVAMLIDRNAVHTLQEFGLDVPDRWIVDTTAEVESQLANWKAIREEQRELWQADYRGQLIEQIKEAFRLIKEEC